MKSLKAITACVLAALLAAGNALAGQVAATAVVNVRVNSASSISVAPSTFDFGTLVGSITHYRFRTGVAQLSYFAAGSYEIRVYTDNGVTDPPNDTTTDRRGFIQDATGNKLFLKVWCPNFNSSSAMNAVNGPALAGDIFGMTEYLWKGYDLNRNGTPDENLTQGRFDENALKLDLNGNGTITDLITVGSTPRETGDIHVDKLGESAVFSWLRERGTMSSEEDTLAAARQYRCVLAWNTPGRGDASLGNPFPVALAADLTCVKNGTYSSNNNMPTQAVVFELYVY
jgi:hypothetical protein